MHRAPRKRHWTLPAAFWALMGLLAAVAVDENFFQGRGAAWVVMKVYPTIGRLRGGRGKL